MYPESEDVELTIRLTSGFGEDIRIEGERLSWPSEGAYDVLALAY